MGRLTADVGTEMQARKNAERQLADHKAQFDRDLAAQLAQFRLLEERAKELEAKLSDATAELGEERQSRQKVERELADEKARFERDLAAQEAQLKSVEESARKTAASRDALQVCVRVGEDVFLIILFHASCQCLLSLY